MAIDDDEQDLERFDVDNDFEDGQWIGGEFHHRGKRQKRQQTAEDRLYGVFAQNSSDEEEFKRRGRREKADYSKPVGFVSSGIIQQQPKQEGEVPQPSGAEPASDSAAHGGIGFGGGGLGFRSGDGAGIGAGSTPADTGAGAGDGEEGEEEVVLPSAFGKRIKAAAEQRRQKEAAAAKAERRRAAAGAAAGDRHAGGAAPADVAKFEVHTKGIGLKLLQKMGYKPGEGLGRQKDGIVKPLEVTLRPKNMGMGFGAFPESKPAVRPGQEPASAATAAAAATTTAPGAQAAPPAPPMWKRRAAAARERRSYKTAEEALAEAADKPLQVQPILDMRGPQTRLVTNLEHLNAGPQEGGGAEAGPPMPELQHNLTLLVDLTQAQLQKLDARLQHEQDTATLLATEERRLLQELERQGAALQRMASLAADVAAAAAAPAAAPLGQLRAAYARMRAACPEEWVLYELSAAALAAALPRFTALMRGWAPLADPARGVPDFSEWRPLLERSGAREAVLAAGREGADGADPYETLVAEVLLPHLRTAITGGWEPRDPEPLLRLVEAWEGALPHRTLSLVLDSLVAPKIAAAVAAWDPRREPLPIHAWLHPWLPWLGSQLEGVYPTIRHKLSTALEAWHPSDGSAALLLAPWARVFAPSDWEALTARSIAPKLAGALGSLVVNPAAQDLAPVQWVLAWAELLPARQMAGLLERGFFPQWHTVLAHWLTGTPDYDEVARWYLGWKSLFPQDLLDNERVRFNFNHALNMMNSAADGVAPMPPPPLPPDGAAAAAPPQPPPAGGAGGAASEPSLRDLVARFAEDAGLEFAPRSGRVHEGLPVYSFGGVSVVLDPKTNMVRSQGREGRWAPVSLEGLVLEARRRRPGG